VARQTKFGSRDLGGKLGKSHVFIDQVKRTVATPLTALQDKPALSVSDKGYYGLFGNTLID
jgi:hypothetical protein